MSIISRGLVVAFAVLVLLGTTPIHAATPITGASSLSRESAPMIKHLPTPIARAWATARVRLYIETLKSAQRSYTADASTYKKEVWLDAEKFLASLREGKYEYAITDAEKKSTEAIILSYQKELVSVLREHINQVRENDTRETGNISMTFSSDTLSFDLEYDPYTVINSQDMRKTEVEMGIKYRIYWKWFNGKSASIYARGKVLRIDNHLYLTLNDYNIVSTIDWVKLIEDTKLFLEKIKWKTYHQELDKEMAEALHDWQKSLESAEKLLKKLETISLLTPVAREGSSYILMFRKSTILELARLTKTSSITDIQLRNLLIPVDLRLDGTTMKITGYTPGLQISGSLSRDTTGTAFLTLDGRERATYDPWNWRLSRTPGYWAFAMSSDKYTVNAKATKNSAEATVKEWDKTIATARIDETGLNAWSYNMQAAWDNLTYDWENDTTKTETLTFRVYWALRQEFGTFTLVPPTLYEEMSKLTEQFR